MGEEEERQGPDLTRIGLFKEMSYLEYSPPKLVFNEASYKGKQMMTNCTKPKSAMQDGYFDKSFHRIFEGEAYSDPVRLRRLNRLESAKKNSVVKFINANPPKKPCGLGSNYGTFDDYVHKLEYFSSRPREVEPSEPPKKNFFVNPGKKGTGYGYANLTIGKMPSYFLKDEYEELKNTSHIPARPEPRPFKPYRAGLYQQKFFDPNPYKKVEPRPSPPPPEETVLEESKEKEIFRPTSPAKKDGGMKAGCLNKFPEHTREPFPKPYVEIRGVKHHVDKENKIFCPVPKLKPYPVKSIITKNVEKKVIPNNFLTTKGVVYCKK